jgi:hypothetical protein
MSRHLPLAQLYHHSASSILPVYALPCDAASIRLLATVPGSALTPRATYLLV